MAQDYSMERVIDLSTDHKPESQSEQERITGHYNSMHGADTFLNRSRYGRVCYIGVSRGHLGGVYG
jgi:hypothetical protein